MCPPLEIGVPRGAYEQTVTLALDIANTELDLFESEDSDGWNQVWNATLMVVDDSTLVSGTEVEVEFLDATYARAAAAAHSLFSLILHRERVGRQKAHDSVGASALAKNISQLVYN
eukprot:SAG31_NODE_14731_length_790_cov_1.026049_2_plen_116_part_00